jgi:cell division protein FtsB
MRKIIFFLAVAFTLFIINNLAHSIYDIWQKHTLVDQAQKELQQQKEDNARLKSRYLYVQSQEFIEKEARNKLQLVKPGETVLLMPSISISPTPKSSQKLAGKPHWQEWLGLFFDFN